MPRSGERGWVVADAAAAFFPPCIPAPARKSVAWGRVHPTMVVFAHPKIGLGKKKKRKKKTAYEQSQEKKLNNERDLIRRESEWKKGEKRKKKTRGAC